MSRNSIQITDAYENNLNHISFNHRQGSCPRCDGIGQVTELDVHKLVDFDKCLNDSGAINYVAFEPGQWRWIRYAYSSRFQCTFYWSRI